MLTFVKGNLFDSPAKVLVNTVNTVGVMGKGIARTFKDVYPDMFERYVQLCESKRLDIGTLWLYRTDHKWVLNFPTKVHWRQPSKLEYIEAGLEKFVDTYTDQGIASVAFPQLGCGNGELEWQDVEPLMVKYLRGLPINVYIYLYDRDPNALVEHKDLEDMRKWLRTEPRVLAFGEFWSDIKEVVRTTPRFVKLNNGAHFSAEVVKFDQEGIVLYFADRTWFQAFRDSVRSVMNASIQKWRFASQRGIFIPEDSFLELWQNIRFYGFCFSQAMPPGMEVLTNHLLPILAKLPYLKPARLATSSGRKGELEYGLQLIVPETVAGTQEQTVEAAFA